MYTTIQPTSINSRLMMKTRALAQVSVLLRRDRLCAHLETVYCGYHDDRYQGERRRASCNNDDQVYELQKYVNQTNSTGCRRTYVNDRRRENLGGSENPLETMEEMLTKVPRRSMNTKKRMEKRQKPHSSGRKISSHRLWTVELIQRRRWENKTRVDSGAIVCATASGVNFVLNVGKCLRSRVVR